MLCKIKQDKYLYAKQEGTLHSDDSFCPDVPVDLNGQPFPIGISAADKSRNMKQTKQGVEDRLKCY